MVCVCVCWLLLLLLLLLLGLGVFESCEKVENLNRGCTNIQQISAVLGGIATFEIRLIFRHGGMCTNQAVRLLSLQKDSNPETVFTCSNIAGFANRNNCNDSGNVSPRYRSVQLESCNDCKYYIDVQLSEVNSSDAGNYTATVTLREDNTNNRVITKRFTLSITGNDTTTFRALMYNYPAVAVRAHVQGSYSSSCV